MVIGAGDLWQLIQDRQQLDPSELTAAIEEKIAENDLDYRTRLLIRDCLNALRQYWGDERFGLWLDGNQNRKVMIAISQENFEKVGFPSLSRRVMDVTQPETVKQFFRDLGQHVDRPVELLVGGAIALIMRGHLSRKTEDIDVVDEVPAEIRKEQSFLRELSQRYFLELAHFQSHYLPKGWETRLHSLEPFGQLRVYLVDRYDVFLSKLFSARDKDRDDLRHIAAKLDKDTLTRKLNETTQSLLASPDLRQNAEHNWYVLYGEALPQ